MQSNVPELPWIERRMVESYVTELARAGWILVDVYDGIDTLEITTTAALLEELRDGTGDVWARFKFKTDDRDSHSVRFITGNDEDIMSDYTVLYDGSDADGFDALMDSLSQRLATRYAR